MVSLAEHWENDSVQSLQGVGVKISEALERLSIKTVRDLLLHCPMRYENRQEVVLAAHAPSDRAVAVIGRILRVDVVGQRKRMLRVELQDASCHFSLRFFHFFPQQCSQFVLGQWLWCFGEIKYGYEGLEMIHPEYALLDDPHNTPHATHFTPVYPTTEGLRQLKLRALIENVLPRLHAQGLSDPLADYLDESWLSLNAALTTMHHPALECDFDALDMQQHASFKRLALEELIAHHLAVLSVKKRYQKDPSQALPVGDKCQTLAQQLRAELPFTLTRAQERVLGEISQDLTQNIPMLRLVQGDVGSGKTLVAAFSALQAIAQGVQVAFMAPTELLAEQHFANFQKWFAPLHIAVGFLSASQTDKIRKQELQGIAQGDVKLVVGTHALFQKHVVFHDLALVIIDEQHRFGVHQRLALKEKGRSSGYMPHQLVMTATPIPRTLAMTAYADLACSVIDELPKGRKAITTSVLSEQRRDEVIARVRHNCIEEKRQVYWVCPLIEESDKLQCQAAQAAASTLQEHCPELRIELVHGRMKAKDKQAVMQRFSNAQVDVLVATTVIEVGVDVPNASLMIIENAERLGLAQLHQLRGRIGRGDIASHCVLLYKQPLSPESQKRLAVMRDTQDGFVIAEADLDIRGPGEWLGVRQTGLVNLKVANLVRDKQLIPQAKKIAMQINASDANAVALLMQRWLDVDAYCADV